MAHLKVCVECNELLHELQGMSRFFAAAPMTRMSDDAMRGFARRVCPNRCVAHRRLADDCRGGGVAGGLPVWRHDAGVETTPIASTADVLDTVAVTPPGDTGSHNDLSCWLQWMSTIVRQREALIVHGEAVVTFGFLDLLRRRLGGGDAAAHAAAAAVMPATHPSGGPHGFPAA